MDAPRAESCENVVLLTDEENCAKHGLVTNKHVHQPSINVAVLRKIMWRRSLSVDAWPCTCLREKRLHCLLMLCLVGTSCTVVAPHEPPTNRILDVTVADNASSAQEVQALLADATVLTGVRQDEPFPTTLRRGRQNAVKTNYYIREESPFYQCRSPGANPSCNASPRAAITANDGWPTGLPRACLGKL